MNTETYCNGRPDFRMWIRRRKSKKYSDAKKKKSMCSLNIEHGNLLTYRYTKKNC